MENEKGAIKKNVLLPGDGKSKLIIFHFIPFVNWTVQIKETNLIIHLAAVFLGTEKIECPIGSCWFLMSSSLPYLL